MLANPIHSLWRTRRVRSFAYETFKGEFSLFALSACAMTQLHDVLTLERTIPEPLWGLTYAGTSFRPDETSRAVVAETNLAIVEMTSPLEVIFDGYVLNINRFEAILGAHFLAADLTKKAYSQWRNALMKMSPALDEIGADIVRQLPATTDDEKFMIEIVRGTRCRRLARADMQREIGELKERLRKPMSLIAHNFQFMADGRPVSWPPEFKGDSVAVAEHLGIPTFDFAPLVAREGVPRMMMDDNRHWRDEALPVIADALLDHMHDVVGSRPLAATAKPQPAVPAGPSQVKSLSPAVDGDTLCYHHATGIHFDFDPHVLPVVVFLGEAWAIGANADPEDATISTLPSRPGHALMFNGGAAPKGSVVSRFVDLCERQSNLAKETPCSGAADAMMAELEAAFGRLPRVLFLAAGKGGTTLSGAGQSPDDGLLKGTTTYRRITDLLASAKVIAALEDKTPRVIALCLLHGFADARAKTSREDYTRQLLRLRQTMSADIRRLTGQTEEVPLLLTQANRGATRLGWIPEVALAQLEATTRDPNIRCIGPVYHLEPEGLATGQASRFKADAYRRLGRTFGRFIVHDLFGRGLHPLRTVAWHWTDRRTIVLRYNRPIALDEAGLVSEKDLGPGKGIQFVDGSAAPPTITTVRLIGSAGDLLEVRLSSASIGSRPQLLIANSKTGSGHCGRHEGARSLIRSRDPMEIDPLGGDPVHHWACTELLDLR